MLNWFRDKNVGLHYDLYLSGSGPEYNPGIGFQHREDYYVYGAMLNYTWMMPEKSRLIRHGPIMSYFDFWSQSRGIRESIMLDLMYELEFKSLWRIRAGMEYSYENLFELFELSDEVNVPVGDYNSAKFSGFLMTPMTKPFWMGLALDWGGFYDGRVLSVNALPSWSLSSSFVLTGGYVFSKVDFSKRDQHFLSHIGRLKALLMFSTKLSLSAFIQYNTESHQIGSNIRFRYNTREGNDLWIVYNEGTNTDLVREIPNPPRLAGRTVMLKYTYTFRL
jgi:hypothetical protein